jgi:tetratricopeptide (TPR) repeat protein
LNSRRVRAEKAEQTSSQLAEEKTSLANEKSALAEREAAARRQADEQGLLALETLKTVTIRIARQLKPIEGAAEVQKQLLTAALGGLQKVVTSLESRTDADREQLKAHNEIGRIYMTIGNTEGGNSSTEALKHFQKAFEIGTKLAATDPSHDAIQRDLSISQEFLGDVHAQLGNLKAADDAYAESLRISEQRLAKNPDDIEMIRDVGFGHEKVADIFYTRGQLADAKIHLTRSTELYQKTVAAQPDNATYQRDVLVAKSRIGNIQRREGALDDAAKTFRECVATCEKLEAIPNSEAQRRDRSVNLNKLGTVLFDQSKFTEAAEVFNAGLQIARDVLMAEPKNATARRDLAISLKYMGDTSRKRRESPAARAYFSESLVLRRQLAGEDTLNQVAQVDVAALLSEMGDLELADGKPETARPLLEEASTILTKLKDAGKLDGADDKKLLERTAELRQKL